MTRPSARRVIAAALLTTWCAAGCLPCETGGESVMRWSFESCADAACGFGVEAGSARRWATYHGGEHGLLLGPNTSVRAFSTRPWPEGSRAPAVQLLARCDEGTALALEVEVPGGISSPAEPTTRRSIVSASPRWAPHFVRLPEAHALYGFSLVRLVTTGSGNCQVDDIELRANDSGVCQ